MVNELLNEVEGRKQMYRLEERDLRELGDYDSGLNCRQVKWMG